MIQLRHCRSIFVHCVGLIYAILYEDNRALYLARADENDGIVRLIDALDDAALERAARVCDDLREAFRGKKRLEILAHFVNRQLGARRGGHAQGIDHRWLRRRAVRRAHARPDGWEVDVYVRGRAESLAMRIVGAMNELVA